MKPRNHGVNEMTEQMNFQDRVNKAVQDALAAALPQMLAAANQNAAPAKSNGNRVYSKDGRRDLTSKDAGILAGLKRKGYKDIVMPVRKTDGSIDESKPYNVKPYGVWQSQGRQVRKDEHGVRGLFHISQTDPIAKKAN
jgi:hypothetical protein